MAVSVHSGIAFIFARKIVISSPFMPISSEEKGLSFEVILISSEEMRILSEEKAFYSE